MVKLTDKNFHDNYVEHGELEVGSDRSFAWVFTGFFTLVGMFPVIASGTGPRIWALAVAGVFLGLGLVAPSVLHPLNVVWMRFGLLLNMIVSPLVLGGLFFIVFTPMALVLRLFGKKLLNLEYEPGSRSYWIDRNPPGPPPETMKNQF